jgi:hypothetical protein
MPFVFVVVGLLFLVVAVRGTQDALFSLLKTEFTGTGSFIPWAAAIFILGAVGYAKPIKPIADAMIGLVLLAMILNNKGSIFKQFETQIANPTAPNVSASSSSAGSASSAGSGNYGSPQSAFGAFINGLSAPSSGSVNPNTVGGTGSAGAYDYGNAALDAMAGFNSL